MAVERDEAHRQVVLATVLHGSTSVYRSLLATWKTTRGNSDKRIRKGRDLEGHDLSFIHLLLRYLLQRGRCDVSFLALQVRASTSTHTPGPSA
jgi:hypothetical protein